MENKLDLPDPSSCHFYHTVELPDGRRFEGEWDLRGGIDDYLGHVDFQGKRVLDVGAANGFLSFSMEKRGASEVISYDLDPERDWDVVPYASYDHKAWLKRRKKHTRKVNNAYWLCHRAFQSKAKLVHGSVYHLPLDLGQFDVSVLGSILLHLREPWGALQSVAAATKETIIVVEKLPRRYSFLKYLPGLEMPWMTFLPDAKKHDPIATWWILTPSAICRMLGVLGFGDTQVRFHTQPLEGKRQQLYTVVARRSQIPH